MLCCGALRLRKKSIKRRSEGQAQEKKVGWHGMGCIAEETVYRLEKQFPHKLLFDGNCAGVFLLLLYGTAYRFVCSFFLLASSAPEKGPNRPTDPVGREPEIMELRCDWKSQNTIRISRPERPRGGYDWLNLCAPEDVKTEETSNLKIEDNTDGASSVIVFLSVQEYKEHFSICVFDGNRVAEYQLMPFERLF